MHAAPHFGLLVPDWAEESAGTKRKDRLLENGTVPDSSWNEISIFA